MSSGNKLKIESRKSYWAGTALPFMLGPFNGYVVFPILCFLFYPRYWTAAVLIFYMLVSIFLDRMGYTLPVMIRAVITIIGGRRVSRLPMIGKRIIWK